MNIQKELKNLGEEKYGDFCFKLTPTLDRKCFIGVRSPLIKKLAKEVIKDEKTCNSFLSSLPHKYYDENMLHSAILSNLKDYDETLKRVEEFLPYVDNWAVCDTLKPKCFLKHKVEMVQKLKKWAKSKETYTIRFGIELLMNDYLDDNFDDDYPKLISKIRSKEYYVNMMIAWYFATALAKKWDEIIPYIENNTLDIWTHNKTIQKAIESYRISDEQKAYLKTLKR